MENRFSIYRALLIVLTGGYFSIIPVAAQNLVPNPDFDDFSICPNGRGQIPRAAPWYSPNGRTTDFAHVCAANDSEGIPQNAWGIEYPYAGDGYAGLRTWGDFNSFSIYREYMAVELIDSLKAGENYRVSFRVSMGDSARYRTDDIALHFSKDSIPDEPLLAVEPHIANPQGNIINNASGWELIQGQYTARGGERFIVIGNFLDDDQTTRLLRSFPEGVGANSTYFYIDHVVVEPCSSEFPDRLIIATDSLICPGESIELRATPVRFASYLWEDAILDTALTVSQPGIYTLETKVDGCTMRDSIEILPAPLPVFDLGPDTLLCPGESILIGIEDSVDSFRWNDRNDRLKRPVDSAGRYTLEVALGKCTYSNSIEINYEKPYVQAPPKDTLLCETDRIVFLPSIENATYLWSDFSTNPSLETSEMGQYWVDISTNCFSARESFNISTQNCSCESFIPNVFSPNDDGIQDQFQLSFTEGISEYSLEVFDRYGRPFFSSKNPNENWDGRLNGKRASEGVYYWVAQYTCFAQGEFRQQVKKGHVSLLR